MNSQKKKPFISPVAGLIIGVFAISFSSIFIRWAQDDAVPSLAIAAWRTAVAAIILLPVALARRRAELRGLSRRQMGFALLSGAALGLHFGSWIQSLEYTSIASSTALVATSPLWVGLASPFLLRETLSRYVKIGIALAIVGSALIGLGDAAVWENGRLSFNIAAAAGSNPLLGNGLAFIGALSAAVYLLIGRVLRRDISLLSYTAVVYATAALTLLTAALLRGTPLFGYTPSIYLLFILMAVFPQLIGHSSFNWALGFLPAAYVSIAVISEPIGATILGIILFREIPGAMGIIGGILILTGIVISSRKGETSAAEIGE